ncbi:MAG: PAS domain-containing protein [Alphaproteobacteria bacterium]|nr:PAS domain-containing protein [Alphaproteobacteria bacterium]
MSIDKVCAAPVVETIDVVAIGGSAGCLLALKAVFEALPADTGAAFVVIVHLDPTHHSDLATIIADWTPMPVHSVSDRTKLAANAVYVIAPDQALTIAGGNLIAAPFTTPRGHRAPIDTCFRSLAETPKAGIAVVLSGSGSDGALGVATMCERGGLALAQDPDDAEVPAMPLAAIKVGVDVVLPAPLLGPRIAELLAARRAIGDDIAKPSTEPTLQRVFALVRDATGHDFSHYKRAKILRRIARRMQITHTTALEGYANLLKKEPAEGPLLVRDLLVSVTRFFRDAAAFETLRRDAIAPLLARDRGQSGLRVWVPACATGEEAYSIAMLLVEEADRAAAPRPPIQIFATDIDEQALAVARIGRYASSIDADVSQARLARFFTRVDNGYQVNQELRDLVIFSTHDVLSDPAFAQLDLISCRNLLLYLERALQAQALSTFSYALRADGFLFLGASETVELQDAQFTTVDREAHLYRLTRRARLAGPPMPPRSAVAKGADAPVSSRPRSLIQPVELHRIALETNAPPSILVDSRHRIINVSDTAGRFLQHPAGAVTADATALVRPELALDLRAALHRAFEHDERTVTLPVPVALDGAVVSVVLQVRPTVSDAGVPSALVLFVEGGRVDPSTTSTTVDGDTGTVASKLREELAATRTLLRVSREQYEQATDELRASNEELQSINEEYRATAEELETSKEELQSINEELQTLNGELTIRLTMVSQASNDLLNLMAATEIATVFLDTDLCIKRFTPPITSLFNVHAGDEGRPIADFSHRLDYPTLIEDARAVLASLTPAERLITSQDGRHFTTRLRPYRTVDDRIEGVVVTFFDDTERFAAETAFAARQKLLLSEMAHRVKNTLAVVQSLIGQSLRGSTTPPAVVAELTGRLASLSRSHDLLLDTEWKGAALADLVAAQVMPHAAGARITASGPPVKIPAETATPLGLVLNELVTNAAKYGALSTPEGGVDLAWRIDASHNPTTVILDWREHDGPPVTAPVSRGKGLRLIEACLPATDVTLAFDRDGLRARIRLPCETEDAAAAVPATRTRSRARKDTGAGTEKVMSPSGG